MKHKVAILGGGISGLSAAVRLNGSEACEFVVYEQSSRLGGVLETYRDDRYLIEKCADNFATLIPDALEMSKELGLEGSLIRPNEVGRQAFVLHRGSVCPIPLGFSLMQPTRLWSIVTTPTLSMRGKLRVLVEYFVRARNDVGDESLESFATRRLGKEAFENLVEPIVGGIFTANPATLSVAATLPQFIEMERKYGGLIRAHFHGKRANAAAASKRASGARYDQFVAPVDGMSSWIEAIADTLPPSSIRLNSQVSSVDLDQHRKSWTVRLEDGSKEEFDGLICALPNHIAARLLEPALPEASKWIASTPYASSAGVAMVVNVADFKARTDGFGLIIPAKEHRSTMAISYTSNKYPGRVPNGELLLRIFLGGALKPEVVDYDDERLLEMAYKEVREILGWTGERAKWQTVVRWRNAMPQYTIGHLARMESLRAALEDTPTLALCGAGYEGVGIPQCVRTARKAADQLTKHFAVD